MAASSNLTCETQDTNLLGSDREIIEVARQAGIPGRIAHEKAVGLEHKGLIAEVVKLVEAARAEGLDITTDQYPYDGAATARLEEIVVVPDSTKEQPGFDLKAALRDPASRRALQKTSEEGVDGGFAWLKATGYSHMRITSAPDSPELVGRYLSELADERGKMGFDLVADLILGSNAPVGITLGAIAEEDLRALLVQPWNMVASDGGYPGGDAGEGHPRSAGTFPRVLGHYVRELGLLNLEDAIRKMTSLPASNLGLHDRGRVAEGMAADITIFDPSTIADRSTWEDPHRFSEGVAHVLVNGEFALKGGELTGDTPGRHLRRPVKAYVVSRSSDMTFIAEGSWRVYDECGNAGVVPGLDAVRDPFFRAAEGDLVDERVRDRRDGLLLPVLKVELLDDGSLLLVTVPAGEVVVEVLARGAHASDVEREIRFHGVEALFEVGTQSDGDTGSDVEGALDGTFRESRIERVLEDVGVEGRIEDWKPAVSDLGGERHVPRAESGDVDGYRRSQGGDHELQRLSQVRSFHRNRVRLAAKDKRFLAREDPAHDSTDLPGPR